MYNLGSILDNHPLKRPRTLSVYSNIGESVIVGDQVTDLLGEIKYKPSKQGTIFHEPKNPRYQPVRNKEIEIVEVQLAETDGGLAKIETGDTLLTLHFKKE